MELLMAADIAQYLSPSPSRAVIYKLDSSIAIAISIYFFLYLYKILLYLIHTLTHLKISQLVLLYYISIYQEVDTQKFSTCWKNFCFF